MPSFYLLLLLIFIQWQQTVLPEQLENTRSSANTPEHCAQLLAHTQTNTLHAIPQTFKVLSWNIYKASHPQLMPDLEHFAQQANFLLLQEAYDDSLFKSLKPYAQFAPGYRSYRQQTGLIVLSDWPAQLSCRFYQREPWLRTPKASSVSRYALQSGKTLLVINMHGINFTIGTTDYEKQLGYLTELVGLHNGPVIFAGDFNTWNDKRWEIVDRTLTALEMTRVSFTPDLRTTAFGLPLDHVWVRGVTVSKAQTLKRTSSDHNPLLVSLRITTAINSGDAVP